MVRGVQESESEKERTGEEEARLREKVGKGYGRGVPLTRGWDGICVRRSLRKFAEGCCSLLRYKIGGFVFWKKNCVSALGDEGLRGSAEITSLKSWGPAGRSESERTCLCRGTQRGDVWVVLCLPGGEGEGLCGD